MFLKRRAYLLKALMYCSGGQPFYHRGPKNSWDFDRGQHPQLKKRYTRYSFILFSFSEGGEALEYEIDGYLPTGERKQTIWCRISYRMSQ